MDVVAIANLFLGTVTFIVALIVIPLSRRLREMRTNDMAHLEQRLERIERLLDEHLMYHRHEQ